MGNVLFCIIFPQCLALFNEHVSLLAGRENSRDWQALIIRVRRRLWQQRGRGHFYLLALHWLPCLVSIRVMKLDSKNQEWVKNRARQWQELAARPRKKREWTWGLPYVGFFCFISSLFLDMYPFQLNELKILRSWTWADQMLHQGDSHKNTISALSQYVSKLISKI